MTERVEAALFTRLPDAFHYRGEPNAWVRMTRPGQNLHSFLEGPTCGADGSVWLADVPYGRIFRISPEGEWSLAYEYDGEPHGLAFDSRGTLLICDYRHGLLSLDPGATRPVPLLEGLGGSPFRGIADLAVAENGALWITEPGRSSLSDPHGRLLRWSPGDTGAEVVLDALPYPNSVTLSPDGRMVYLSLTRANCIWRLLADGPETPPMAGVHIALSGGLGPDGLAMHPAGLLAVAQAQAGRAYLFDALGDLIARFDTPGGAWTTAVRFSPDGRSLLIVEARTGALYRADITAFLPPTNREG